MEELMATLRREPEGAVLVAANVAGLVLVIWLLIIAS